MNPEFQAAFDKAIEDMAQQHAAAVESLTRDEGESAAQEATDAQVRLALERIRGMGR